MKSMVVERSDKRRTVDYLVWITENHRNLIFEYDRNISLRLN